MMSKLTSRDRSLYDCTVIGAGPAGLTAALYLARFRRSVIVCDGGRSRAQWIPESHNCPGFPGGISGNTLLERLRAQLSAYDAPVASIRIERMAMRDGVFLLTGRDGFQVAGRKVLLATGIVDVLPAVDWIGDAIGLGALRLCPVCDGYEVSDQRIAVYGVDASALDHAAFLRTYSSEVALVCTGEWTFDSAQRDRASSLGLRIIERAKGLHFDGRHCSIEMMDGKLEPFDCVYAFLGCHAQSDLAQSARAQMDAHGALRVDADQMTSVEGLYAAGDVVSALHQIAVAVGHAGVAATAMHNALALNPRQDSSQ